MNSYYVAAKGNDIDQFEANVEAENFEEAYNKAKVLLEAWQKLTIEDLDISIIDLQ